MTIDKATIINWALTDIGAGPMFSVDDDTDIASQIKNCWQPVVDRCFGLQHDWSFALNTYRNERHAAKPANGWGYGFDLPGLRIGNPVKIMDQAGRSPRPLRNFTIEAGKLFCEEPETWSTVKTYVNPDVWPPEWRAAFVVALAAYLAVPVWQDADLRNDLLTEAFGTASRDGTGGMFGRLMAQDKASRPIGEPQAWDDPLTNARFSGTSDHWAGRYA